MSQFNRKTLTRWIGQLRRPPHGLVIGVHDGGLAHALGQANCKLTWLSPLDPKTFPRVMGTAPTLQTQDFVVVLPSVGEPLRTRLVETLPHVAASVPVHLCETPPTEEMIDGWLFTAIAKAQARAPVEIEKKNGFSGMEHHRASGTSDVVSAFCALDSVAYVRYRKKSGDDLTCHVVGDAVHVNYRESIGMVVTPCCSHPAHVERCCAEIREVLDSRR